MKRFVLFILISIGFKTYAQQTPLPHGMVFGQKPDTTIIVAATKAEAFMGKKIRINTTLRGRVSDVTKQKGGWFNLDAGGGKVISAHFKNYAVMLPTALKGRVVIIEGVAVKPVDSTNGQRFGANMTVKNANTLKKKAVRLTFEVSGLMVYK